MKRSFQSGSQKRKRKREHDRVINQLPTVDCYFSGTQGDLNSDNYNSPTLQQNLLTDYPKIMNFMILKRNFLLIFLIFLILILQAIFISEVLQHSHESLTNKCAQVLKILVCGVICLTQTFHIGYKKNH